MCAKRFRVAFSFAGEVRDYVVQVADILAAGLGKDRILYDKYHEAEFARRDLGIYLPELYHKESDLVVLVIGKDYDDKTWCGLEWTAIHALLKDHKDHEVMLCRFDHALIKGLYGTAGFVEWDRKTPQQAANLILARLALNSPPPSASTPPPLKSPIPNNLPRLQPFFGRVDELAKIREALDPDNRTWGALIDGAGGMGKTSLAVRAAYDCTADQFKKIIFVSVKSHEMDDDGVRPLGNLLVPGLLEMLNEIASELGQPDIAKSAEDQRIRLLLEALRPAQALLILDNLESLPKAERDQLFNFVKRLPAGCKAILTSRRRIGSGSELLILEKLDQEAALATLADLARHNPLLARTSEAERVALYTQTGGKPLLLRWTAGQIGRGSCRTFTEALAYLRSCPPDNDPLEFIFGDLAAEFTGPETKALCALTYFTLPASIEHIAALAGMEEAPIETALHGLANRSLVVPDQEERAYALVPMVAEFLARRHPEVIAETGDRMENRAYALIMETGYEGHVLLPVLEAAWPSVAPALPRFLAGDNPRLQDVCDALQVFLNFQGRWDEWMTLNEKAEAKALAAGDHYNAGWRANDAGYIHSFRGQGDAVIPCANRAAGHWQTARTGASERAAAIRLRGHGHRLRKDYPAAIADYREALELDRSVAAESADVANDLNSLATAESDSGDLTNAGRDYREALRVAEAVGHAKGVATYTGNLAALALERKDWPQAETMARKALPLAEGVHRKQLIGSNNHRLAKALMRQGKAAEALPYARKAVGIYEALASPYLEQARRTLTECEAASPNS